MRQQNLRKGRDLQNLAGSRPNAGVSQILEQKAVRYKGRRRIKGGEVGFDGFCYSAALSALAFNPVLSDSPNDCARVRASHTRSFSSLCSKVDSYCANSLLAPKMLRGTQPINYSLPGAPQGCIAKFRGYSDLRPHQRLFRILM